MVLLRSPSGGLPSIRTAFATLLLAASLALPVAANDVLETNGFSTCLDSDQLVVEKMDIKYDRAVGRVTFDVAGTSKAVQRVRAVLKVEAYGREVYRNEFNPCDDENKIDQLCPIPSGHFEANDELPIPEKFAGMVPDIAFQIPDLDGMAKLELISLDDDKQLACLQSVVQNGKTASVPEAKYATAAMAAAALLLSGISAAGAASGGSAGPSPSFAEVMFWFQGIAMDGMLSVNYPKVYRSFTDNFAWSTGLVSWEGMQRSIDNFRKSTGGNLDLSSVDVLLNTTLVYTKNSNETEESKKLRRRWAEFADLAKRQDEIDTGDINATVGEADPEAKQENSTVMKYVEGIEAKVDGLKIPSANTFMTVLLIFCIILAAVTVCILLFKVILEIWALFASFPKSLTGFRKRYWTFLMTTIVRIILILYGTWTLYCLYQFNKGDSWGAHVLAGVTLAVFTGILSFFAFRIFTVVSHARKNTDEAQEQLFVHKPYLRKYGLFYDQFKSNFWWVFFPLILYAFAKGAFIALGEGHGLVQSIGQLSCEVLLLCLLLWSRPYNTKMGNVLNIIISCVRVLSVVCLIVFVDQMNIAADTKSITGVALIVIQSTLTAVLAICLIINAIYAMVKENPHKKQRKMMEKQREADLTPLHPHDSILFNDPKGAYQPTPTQDTFRDSHIALHQMTPAPQYNGPLHSTHSRADSEHALASPRILQNQQHPAYEGYRGAAPPQHQHPAYEDYRGSGPIAHVQ